MTAPASAMIRIHSAVSPNTKKSQYVAAYAGVDIEMVAVEMGKDNKTAAFLASFPWGKVPAMETADGPLYESNALAYYVAAKYAPTLLGSGAYQAAQVVQYICSLDCELNPAICGAVYPLYGYGAFDAATHKTAVGTLKAKLAVFDGILVSRTFLVGEDLSLADIVVACSLLRVFAMLLDADAREALPNLTRWFTTVMQQPAALAACGSLELAEDVVTAPIKAAAKPAAAAAAHAHANEEEEEEAKPVVKAKNAMDLLPAPKMNLEDWKRYYSNAAETRPDATNWFWERYSDEDYSIWRADYMYNDELRKIFMTCNLITGLYARMENMRRYAFASTCIFGEDDKNQITGYFVFRGKEMPDLMREVPDFESYNWTQMDTKDPKQVELFNDYLAWEGDFEGRKFAEGKIFK